MAAVCAEGTDKLHARLLTHTWSWLDALRMKDVVGSDFTMCKGLVLNGREIIPCRSLLANLCKQNALPPPFFEQAAYPRIRHLVYYY